MINIRIFTIASNRFDRYLALGVAVSVVLIVAEPQAAGDGAAADSVADFDPQN